MSTEVKWYQPILWKEGTQKNNTAFKSTLPSARCVEAFWRNLSPWTNEVRVTARLGEHTFQVEPHTRIFRSKDRVLMALEIFLCLLVVPLLIMLVAKGIVHRNNSFSLKQPEPSKILPEKTPSPALPSSQPEQPSQELLVSTACFFEETIEPPRKLSPPTPTKPEEIVTTIDGPKLTLSAEPAPRLSKDELACLQGIVPTYQSPTADEIDHARAFLSRVHDPRTEYGKSIKAIMESGNLQAVKILWEKELCSRGLTEYFAFAYLETAPLNIFEYLFDKFDKGSNLKNFEKSLPDLLFKTIKRKEERSKYLAILLKNWPPTLSKILGSYDDQGYQGLTLLHYAYLYHEEELIKLILEKGGEELANLPSIPISSFNRSISVSPGSCKIRIPIEKNILKNMTAAELARCRDDLAARSILFTHMLDVRPTGRPSDFWPQHWRDKHPTIEEVWPYLDLTAEKLNRRDDNGLTLLHYAKYFRHQAIATQLQQAGADLSVKSTKSVSNYMFDITIPAVSSGISTTKSIVVEAGKTADELAQEFWDAFYLHHAFAILRDHAPITSTKFPSWKESEGRDLLGIIPRITEINKTDEYGLTLLHYAMLLEQEVVQKALLAHRAQAEVATTISQSFTWQIGSLRITFSKGEYVTPAEFLNYCADKFLFRCIKIMCLTLMNREAIKLTGFHGFCMNKNLEAQLTRPLLKAVEKRVHVEDLTELYSFLNHHGQTPPDLRKHYIDEENFKRIVRAAFVQACREKAFYLADELLELMEEPLDFVHGNPRWVIAESAESLPNTTRKLKGRAEKQVEKMQQLLNAEDVYKVTQLPKDISKIVTEYVTGFVAQS